jgi:integrase
MNALQPIQGGLPVQGVNRHYLYDIRVFNRYAAGRPVNAELIENYFDHIKTIYAPGTIGHHKSAILDALKKSRGAGITQGELTTLTVFFQGIKTPAADVRKLREDMLEEKDIKKIFRECGPKTEILIRVLYQTAARVSEAVHIRLDDCEIMGGGVKVRLRAEHAKRNKERFVFMRLETFARVKELYRGKTYLFETNGRAMSRFTAYALIKRAGQKIKKTISPHVLRHSWASNRIGELGLASVSEYLGHADKSTTAKYYLHDMPSMGDVLGGDI